MQLSVSVRIQAQAEKVWEIISHIEKKHEVISAVEGIEVLEQGSQDGVGLKWKETRKFNGKTAEEVMWITDAKKPLYINTRAESNGTVYVSRWTIHAHKEHSDLGIEFTATPVNFMSKLMSALLGGKIRKDTSAAFRKDLQDVKAAAENA
ncbi:SRPBCC family protein [Salinispira pacifica]|uniref:SRPBCC family protein n=1 Tax=Salinispira pacifica TaxID=1307761 RepID=V5WIP9_9SPIO|nr:SRPBCC family protein [Salinispira pacifica]AHC15668.1 hypothetical protein L21SP2_2311 [Salinispira pacifica]